jgi:hypothetical protein
MQVSALFWNGCGPTSVVSTILSQSGLSFASMRSHFHIAEDGRFIEDDEGQEFSNETQVRDEARLVFQSPRTHSQEGAPEASKSTCGEKTSQF